MAFVDVQAAAFVGKAVELEKLKWGRARTTAERVSIADVLTAYGHSRCNSSVIMRPFYHETQSNFREVRRPKCIVCATFTKVKTHFYVFSLSKTVPFDARRIPNN